MKYANNTIFTLYATKYSDSKFSNNYYERKLKVVATTRNFNTISKLVAMTSAEALTKPKKREDNV